MPARSLRPAPRPGGADGHPRLSPGSDSTRVHSLAGPRGPEPRGGAMSVPVQGWVQRSMPATARRFVLRALAAAGACLIPVVPAATRAEEAPDVRLGRDVLPTFQRVSLKLDPDKRSFSGSVHVELTVARSTDTLRLHADGQRLTRVRLAQGGDSVSTTRSTGDHGLQTLAAAHALKVGPATLDIEFTNLYGTRAVGLYRALHEPLRHAGRG